jgi:S1-C subfamily serine protease
LKVLEEKTMKKRFLIWLVSLLILVATVGLVSLAVSPAVAQEEPRKETPEGREKYLKEQFIGVSDSYKKGALDILVNGKIIAGATLVEEGYAFTSLSALPEDSKTVQLRSASGATCEADVVSRHFTYDVALLKLKGALEGAEPLQFGEEQLLKKGQFLFTVGTDKERFRVSVVSQVSRNIERLSDEARKRLAFLGILSEDFPLPKRPYVRALQHDGYIYADMRGLPLIEKTGRIVGVNLGIVWRGVALATPSSVLKEILPAMKKNRLLADYPYFGFKAKTFEKSEAPNELIDYLRQHGIKEGYGVKVTKVYEKSPAQDSGLKEGDVIVFVGVEPIPDRKSLEDICQNLLPSMRIRLSVFREGKIENLELNVGKKPPTEVALKLKEGISEEDARKALEETRTVLMAEPIGIEKDGDLFVLKIKTPVPDWALKEHLRYAETALKSAAEK